MARNKAETLEDSKEIMGEPRKRPTGEEVISFVRNEAYYRTKKELEDVRFLALEEDGLVIAKNTPWETRVLRRSDNTLETDHPAGPGAIRVMSKGKSIFGYIHRRLQDSAKESILAQVKGVFGEDALEADSEPERAISLSARGAVGSASGSYVTQPARLGNHLLHQLIGKERFSEVLRLAGGQATLLTHNAVTLHRAAVEEAHVLNSNAAFLWMGTLVKTGTPSEISAAGIIQAAEEAFGFRAANAAASPERCWTSFSRLNRQAVGDHLEPDSPNRDGSEAADMALTQGIIAMRAGAQPSYTALKELMQNPDGLYPATPGEAASDEAKTKLAMAFVRESGQRLGARGGGTQESLRREMQAIARALDQDGPDAPGGDPGWREWRKLLPQGMGPEPAPPKRGREQPENYRTTNERIARILESPAHAGELRQAGEAVRIDSLPGYSVSLTVRGEEAPRLRLTLRPDRTLEVEENGYWAQLLTLPDPDRGGEPGNMTTRGEAARAAAGGGDRTGAPELEGGGRPGPRREPGEDRLGENARERPGGAETRTTN